ncbi:MAG: hypothetical protein M3Y08_05440, partial [Fibrobacterota bacterium]|nr:hypothetical protein [Fibrobacterota bacterium]
MQGRSGFLQALAAVLIVTSAHSAWAQFRPAAPAAIPVPASAPTEKPTLDTSLVDYDTVPILLFHAQGDTVRPTGGDTLTRDSAKVAVPVPDPISVPSAESDSIAALELEEKSVKARGSKVHRDKEVSRIRLSRQDLQRVAAAQGDPLKVLGTLPGVT